MNFKTGNKINLNTTGKRRYGRDYPELVQKNGYGIIMRQNRANKDYFYTSWYNSSKICLLEEMCICIDHFQPFESKIHNHPLTAIFAEKMPQRAKPKKRLTKKKSVVK